jgi:hypothetical protein
MTTDDLISLLDNQLDELLHDHPKELRTKERAFIAWVLLHIPDLDISESEAVDAIVDGNQEKGIDAVFVPETGGKVVVLQTIYHKDPKGKGIRKNDLVRLFTGVDWLLDGDISRIDNNPRLRAKAEEFREAYIDFEYSTISIILATTAGNGPGKEEIDEVDRFAKKLSERGVPFSLESLFAKDIKEALVTSVHRRFDIDVDLTFVGKPFPYDKAKAGARAIVGVVKGSQLSDMYRQHGFRIFDVNIRNFLGNVKINQGIMKTAREPDDASNFWFYNNGITFVCDEFAFRSLEDTAVRLKNAQIINGCQTVTSLHSVGKDLSDDVEVLVKIIEKKADIDFVRRVTLYANSQNAVRPSDLVGTDTLLLELKRRLLALGVYLETRRGDYKAEKTSLGTPISQVVTLKEAAKACATIFKQIPGVAKKDTSKLFLSKEDGGFFDAVFTPLTSPEQIIMAVSLMRSIPLFRSNLEESTTQAPIWLPHSDFFLAALFYQIYFDPTKVTDHQYLHEFDNWIKADPKGEPFKLYKALVKRVNRTVSKHEKAYGYSHPKFFKTQIEYEVSLKNAIDKKPKQFI